MSIITVSIYDIGMAKIELNNMTVILLSILVMALIISAIRMARIAKQQGFNPYLAFTISLLTTPMPLTLFFWVRYTLQRYKTRGTDIDQLPTLSSRFKHRNRQDRENQTSGEGKDAR